MNTSFELPAELTIYSVLETRDTLLAWVTEHGSRSSSQLEINAAQVEVVDGAGLQLLAALFNMDLPWRLIEPSEAFAEGCRTLGLGNWLGGQGKHSVGGGSKP
jgi:anti-anti-sigma regulatory factor